MIEHEYIQTVNGLFLFLTNEQSIYRELSAKLKEAQKEDEKNTEGFIPHTRVVDFLHWKATCYHASAVRAFLAGGLVVQIKEFYDKHDFTDEEVLEAVYRRALRESTKSKDIINRSTLISANFEADVMTTFWADIVRGITQGRELSERSSQES